jgi:hypothetical protein
MGDLAPLALYWFSADLLGFASSFFFIFPDKITLAPTI